MVITAFADLCVADVPASTAFYRDLLGLDVLVDLGWYVELGGDGRAMLALVQAEHDTVPRQAGCPARGVLVSFDVHEIDEYVARIRDHGCPVIVDLTEELGQRHVMVLDPDGTVVDVIERVPMTSADRRRLARYRRQHLARTHADR